MIEYRLDGDFMLETMNSLKCRWFEPVLSGIKVKLN